MQFFSVLLQDIDTGAAEAAEKASQKTLTLLDILAKGGAWIMIPLAILAIATIFIFIERLLTIKQATKNPKKLLDEVKQMIKDGDPKGALEHCQKENSPVSRMIAKAITKLGSPLKNIETSIENVGKIEIYRLEKNLNLMGTIAGAAPMIGFFGTVTGMISAFIEISQEEGQVSPKLLSAGIYEAMVTTATGLAIGIIAYVAYNYLVGQIQKVVHRMEYTSIDFIDLLQEPK